MTYAIVATGSVVDLVVAVIDPLLLRVEALVGNERRPLWVIEGPPGRLLLGHIGSAEEGVVVRTQVLAAGCGARVTRFSRELRRCAIAVFMVAMTTGVGVVTMVASSGPADGVPSGAVGKIAFRVDAPGYSSSNIWTMNPDGSALTQITNTTWNDQADWSPDGTKIVYTTEDTPTPQIMIMNADGSAKHNVSNSSDGDSVPSWSPDGTQIAFRRDRVGQPHQIWVMNADGTNQHNVTNDSATDISPVWSPDGTKIAYASNPGTVSNIWTVKPDGTAKTNVTNFALGATGAYEPSFAPDGTRLSFSRQVGADWEIWLVNSDGTSTKQLTSLSGQNIESSWAPDGTKLLFLARPANNASHLDVINADGSGLTNLTPTLAIGGIEPSWQPIAPGAPATISGRITNGATGLAGIYVIAVPIAHPAITAFVQTDATGNYTLHVPADRYALAVIDWIWIRFKSPVGYLPQWFGTRSSVDMALATGVVVWNGGAVHLTDSVVAGHDCIPATYGPGVDKTGQDLSGEFLDGCDLTGTNLTNTNLTGASLTGANLTGTTWSNTTCPDGTNSDTHAHTCVGHL